MRKLMSVKREETLDAEIEIVEEKIVYLKGKRLKIALKEYRKLILPRLNEPMFLTRSE
jgi:hypothetical protein